MNRVFWFLFFLIKITSIQAQTDKYTIKNTVNYQKFGKKDGLPSSKTRTVFEDSRGYIWVGTYSGVSRFDGESFYSFEDQESRTTRQIEQIIEIDDYRIVTRDILGNVDIIYKNIVIKKIENDISITGVSSIQNFNTRYFIITRHPLNRSATIIDFHDAKTFEKVKSQSFPFYGTVYKTKGDAILLLIRTKEERKYIALYKVDDNNDFRLIEMEENTHLGAFNQSCFISEDRKLQYDYNINGDKIIINQRSVDYSESDLADFSLEKTYKEEGYFRKSADNHLHFINNANKSFDFGDLAKLNITIYIDSQQRFWVCSESALYLFPGTHIQTVKLNLTKGGNDEIWSMTRRGDEYYFLSYVFGLFKTDVNLKTKTKVNTDVLTGNTNIGVFGATTTPLNGLFLPLYGSILFIDEANNNHVIDIGYHNDIFSTASNSNSKDLYFSSYRGVYRFDEETKETEKLLGLPHDGISSILAIDFDENDNLITISNSGMLIEDKDKWTANTSENAKGYSLCLDSYGSNWIGSNSGLSEMKADKTMKGIDFGFPISLISDLYVYKEKWLLIGAKDELIIFNLERYHSQKEIEFYRYEYVQYFANDEGGQNNFFEDIDGSVWWPMNGKLVKFYPEKLIQNQTLPAPTIFGILLNVENKQEQLSLINDENVIKIDKQHRELIFQFATPFIMNRDIVKYRTRLVGLNNNWEIIENSNDITYRNLAPGSYQFEIQASIDGKNWTQSTFSNSLNIDAYFHETIWFKILLGILLLFVFYYAIKRYFQERQRELETQNSLLSLQHDLNKMELSNLNKQLDPHEIKNLLASISPEIQEKAPQAYRKMLKLLNITKASLNNSSITEGVGNQVIQIEDYLSLKMNTLAVPFEYVIENNIENKDAPIPRLMLKNLVENAIKHGIKKNKNGGNVSIILTKEDQFFSFVVDDTGKGRSFDIDSDSGIGTSTYQNLFATLNKRNANPATFEIIDKQQGIRVEVRIPINYKYQ